VTSDCQPRTKRPAGPDHNGRGEDELDPVRQRRIDPVVRAGEMATHLQHDRRQRQRAADPESPRHIGELRIGPGLQARDLRLQRHAADRAAAGSDPTDLRMHWAGVDRAGGHFRIGRLVLFVFLGEIFCGIGGEFGAAAGRAEMECLAVVLEAVLGCRGINRHATDGIADLRCRVAMSPAARRSRRLRSGRSGLGGAAAPGICVRLVIMPVFGVVHAHAPALQPIP